MPQAGLPCQHVAVVLAVVLDVGPQPYSGGEGGIFHSRAAALCARRPSPSCAPYASRLVTGARPSCAAPGASGLAIDVCQARRCPLQQRLQPLRARPARGGSVAPRPTLQGEVWGGGFPIVAPPPHSPNVGPRSGVAVNDAPAGTAGEQRAPLTIAISQRADVWLRWLRLCHAFATHTPRPHVNISAPRPRAVAPTGDVTCRPEVYWSLCPPSSASVAIRSSHPSDGGLVSRRS